MIKDLDFINRSLLFAKLAEISYLDQEKVTKDRKKLDYTVRKDVDRKEDDRPYRQQAIQKNIIDEKYGKGYKSPWEKIEKAREEADMGGRTVRKEQRKRGR